MAAIVAYVIISPDFRYPEFINKYIIIGPWNLRLKCCVPDDPHTHARARTDARTGIVRNELIIMWTCQRCRHFRFIPFTYTHARALMSFEAREPTGLKTDIALQQPASRDDPSLR